MIKSTTAKNITFSIMVLLPTASFSQIIRDSHSFEAKLDRTLRVSIKIDAAEFILEPSEEAERGSVEFKYDEENFRGEFDFDPARNRLEVYFRKYDFWDWDKSEKWHDEDTPLLVVKLPYAPEIDLNVTIKAGEVDIELGGLSLTDTDITLYAGELDIRFSKPNRLVMEELHINTKIGESRLTDLGNARSRWFDINSGIGDLRVDLSGEHVDGARAKIDIDLGQAMVSVPSDVGVDLSISKFPLLSNTSISSRLRRSGRHYITRNYDDKEKTIAVKISGGIGSIQVDVD